MTKIDLENALAVAEARRKEQDTEIAALNEALHKQPVRRDTYSEAVRIYGKHSQLIMAMEEMAELTKELSKNIRGMKNTSAISEEMADVEIMLEQLKIIFGNRAEVDRVRCEKLDRLAIRLTDELA